MAAAAQAGVPMGSTVVVLRLFDTPDAEVGAALTPPWPPWMQRLYELERLSNEQVDPQAGVVSLSAALSAVATRLNHRLDLVSWVVSALEETGWTCVLADSHVVAWQLTPRENARGLLERHGIYGPMCKVCELDADGHPLLLRWSDL